MTEIGIGIIGGGYMGKAHSVAMAAVGAVFETRLRPRLEMIAASSPESAESYRAAFGFNRAAPDWQALVDDPQVGAVIIASPQETHREIAEAAIAQGKPVLCEKPLADTIDTDALDQLFRNSDADVELTFSHADRRIFVSEAGVTVEPER